MAKHRLIKMGEEKNIKKISEEKKSKKKPLSMDHIIPVSKGGIHDISNIVPACRSCNSKKGNKSLLIFLYNLCNEDDYYVEGNRKTWIKTS